MLAALAVTDRGERLLGRVVLAIQRVFRARSRPAGGQGCDEHHIYVRRVAHPKCTI
jgi:hypothetical protein